MKHLLWPLLILVVSSLAEAVPAQVLIIRHAEKPPTGDDLSEAGYRRAQELVPYFQTNRDVTEFGTPVAIYAFAPANDSPEVSRRGVETVTPLANALRQEIHKMLPTEVNKLIAEIMSQRAYNGRMVLICWDHKRIPLIATGFGAKGAPSEWPGPDVYDQVWELNFHSGRAPDFRSFKEDVPRI